MSMSEMDALHRLVDGDVKDDKAVYERPALRRIGWLRDVTAGGPSADST
jgi:hypothetical protein